MYCITVTVQRSAPKPYTFKDGLRLPAHTRLSFPTAALSHDASIYPSPSTFDPHRFLRHPTRSHFSSIGETSLNFGTGAHACPGRYYAGMEMKMLLAQLLLRYEIQWPQGKSRPPSMKQDFSLMPDAGAEMMVRNKRGMV